MGLNIFCQWVIQDISRKITVKKKPYWSERLFHHSNHTYNISFRTADLVASRLVLYPLYYPTDAEPILLFTSLYQNNPTIVNWFQHLVFFTNILWASFSIWEMCCHRRLAFIYSVFMRWNIALLSFIAFVYLWDDTRLSVSITIHGSSLASLCF